MSHNKNNIETALVELANMTDNWKDTIPFNKLGKNYQKAIIDLLVEKWDKWVTEWDITFWKNNKSILRIINFNNEKLITVITSMHDFWNPCCSEQ